MARGWESASQLAGAGVGAAERSSGAAPTLASVMRRNCTAGSLELPVIILAGFYRRVRPGAAGRGAGRRGWRDRKPERGRPRCCGRLAMSYEEGTRRRLNKDSADYADSKGGFWREGLHVKRQSA